MPKGRRLLRAVVDTNLFISGMIRQAGLPSALLAAWRRGVFLLLMSTEQREEPDDVLHRPGISTRYGLSEQAIADLFLLIDILGRRVPLRRRLPIHVRDSKDEMVLAGALGGKADYLVTGDADLLVLNGDPKLSKLQIVTARAFLELLESSETEGLL